MPTPTASECGAYGGDRVGHSIFDVARRRLAPGDPLPTPTASDAREGGSRQVGSNLAHQGASLTDKLIRGGSHVGGPMLLALNPDFVDWMMGWPSGWTDPRVTSGAFARWRHRLLEGAWWESPRPPMAIERSERGDIGHWRARLRAAGKGQVSLCALLALVELARDVLG